KAKKKGSGTEIITAKLSISLSHPRTVDLVFSYSLPDCWLDLSLVWQGIRTANQPLRQTV
ncbi:hypothetical protein, partial [Streptococcus sobrinus]|uniref:hypothetical protein n=1 Tax=Streptococcus sobrinus TaxID=1310 RepID=UPI001C3FAF07